MGRAEMARWTAFKPRRCSRAAPWTAAEAEQVLADAAASGLTLYAYARRHGLREQVLYGWRSRLARRGLAAPASTDLAFVPVTATEPTWRPQGGTATDSGVELAIGPVTVRVAPDFCATTLGRLLPVVMGAVSC